MRIERQQQFVGAGKLVDSDETKGTGVMTELPSRSSFCLEQRR